MKKRKIIGILFAFFSFIGVVQAQIDLLGVETDLSSISKGREQEKKTNKISSAKTITNENIENKTNVENTDLTTNELFEDAHKPVDLLSESDLPPKAGDFVDEYIQDLETAQQAQSEARKILQNDPEIITLRQNQHKMIQKGDQKRLELKKHFQKPEEPQESDITQKETTLTNNKNDITEDFSVTETQKSQQSSENLKNVVTENYQAAPFGLYWGISYEELQALGYELQPAVHENYQNVYRLLKKDEEDKVFQEIYGVFGVQNKLWGISAKSTLANDQPNASKILALYQQYYQALEKKYGNAKEFFEPYTYDELVDHEIQNEETGEKTIQKVLETKTNPLGGNNFLEELRSGKASLYATFSDKKIGITLDVFVSKEGQSQLVLDYKNLTLMKQEKDKKFEDLIENL